MYPDGRQLQRLTHDVGLVCKIQHNIWHAKFAATYSLTRWVSGNYTWVSFICNTTISNTSAANPTFSSFIPVPGTRLFGLASEHSATLGTLKGSRGGHFGSLRKHWRTHW